MSHLSQMDFVKRVKHQFSKSFSNTRVLEVGSFNINGSVRQYFTGCDYLGVDIVEGKDVDLVGRAHELDIPKKSFDVAISCECFEHDKYWIETFMKMYASVKDDGLIVFTCATDGRPEHGTTATSPQDSPLTNDYYKNLNEQHFRTWFNLDKMFKEYQFGTNANPNDLYFWGIKG